MQVAMNWRKRAFAASGRVTFPGPLKWAAISACVLICTVGTVRLRAQTESTPLTVAGTVLDPDGKAVPDVAVTVKNEASGAATQATSGLDGRFSAAVQSAGAYTVTATAPGFGEFQVSGVQVSGSGPVDIPVRLVVASMSQTVTVEGFVPLAIVTSPASNTLDATSPKTEISGSFIKNFETPIADYGEVVNYSPGTFTLSPNGAGLGQGKTFFRGLADGLYNVTWDGIPFTDTNSVSHHTWANFPAQWIGSTDFDRSPGQASTVGQSTFGGSINLLSQDLQASPDIRASVSYGSWDTRLMRLDFDSGLFGPGNRNSLLIDVHQMDSNGYQTFNYQKRDAGSIKYQYRVSPRTSITLFSGVVDIWNNTPTNTSPTRAQVQQYGNNYLLSDQITTGTPPTLNAYFFGFNFYHVQTDFEYIGFNSDLGGGWKVDNKAYTYRYWNAEPFANPPITNVATGSVDKLNGYRQAGDIFTLSHDDQWGTFTAGAWYNWAYTDRYQQAMNTLTQVLVPLPNFHEHFITQSFQPFVQYTWKATQKLAVTVGMKDNYESLVLNQYQDGATVGCLGGTSAKDPVSGQPICIGGAAFVTHNISWNNWLPTGTARYQVSRSTSVYAQFAEGSEAPPTSIFDVTGGNVTTPAQPTLAKTYQIGSVITHNRWTLDADAYYLHYQNGYQSYTDIATGEPVNTLTGPSNTKGLEAESNIVIGHGFNLYLNGSMGCAKYAEGPNYPNGGLWVADAPDNVETAGLFYQHRNWDIGILHKRVGRMYNDNKTLTYTINGVKLPFPVDQAIQIDPFDLTNFNFNYTIKNEGWLRGSKIGLSVNNIFNNQNIVGVSAATKPTLTAPFVANAGDLINTLPGRSVMLTLTAGYAPKR
jgi:iron complex outermembrane receptor protein